MIRLPLAALAALALVLPARALGAEPARADQSQAAAATTKPAEQPKAEPAKEAAADPAKKDGYDPKTMGFGAPPAHVGRLRADSLVAASMRAAMEAPTGASDCESAYNGIKALFDTMKKMNYEPALKKQMPQREAWIAQCKKQPPELQKCLVIKYQVEHKPECNKALEDAKAAGKGGFELDDDHSGQSVPDHKH